MANTLRTFYICLSISGWMPIVNTLQWLTSVSYTIGLIFALADNDLNLIVVEFLADDRFRAEICQFDRPVRIHQTVL